MVEFDNVTKIYDNSISAVYDVSFKVAEGEFVFLIGPSGSGKTTIIKMLIRDEVPSKGRIFFNDMDITKVSRRKVYKLRREVGVIFQDFKLVPDKTAYENVAFAMEAAGKKNKEIKEAVPYVLDIVGLSNRMKAFPRQLSGGEQQRVAIARAIANNPKILIADEPTGNLDPASSWDIVQVLTKINNWGTTVIMSTHGTDIVNSLNKRVIQMDKGRVIRDDNKGQYEMLENYEEKKEEEEKLLAEGDKSKKKRKTFQVKMGKEDEKKTSEKEEVEADSSKKSSGFLSKFFGKKKEEPQEDIKEVLEESAPESKPKLSTSLEKPSSGDSDKESEPQDSNDTKSEESSNEDNIDNEMKKLNSVTIDKLNLPKAVKTDLKKAGYKTLGDIVEAGPEKLSESLVIDPEEVILISKEIKRFIDQE